MGYQEKFKNPLLLEGIRPNEGQSDIEKDETSAPYVIFAPTLPRTTYLLPKFS